MPAKATETAWSVVGKIISKQGALAAGQKIWIAQPEASSEFFETLKKLAPAKIEIYQSFRPEVNAISAKGFASVRTLNSGFDLAICIPTRQRTESLGLIAHALRNVSPEGSVFFCCPNTLGAGGFLTRLEEAFANFEADSAQKCRWARLSPQQAKSEVIDSWIEAAAPVTVPETNLRSLPGIFGWNKIDRGSQLLLQNLPALQGLGADLGSGYGYLSQAVLAANPGIEHLHLIEADSRALDCARANLKDYGDHCSYHWLDITAPEVRGFATNLDWIVMNPPFHDGAAVNQEVGKSFVEAAATKLKAGGKLYLVANAFLAYEPIISKRFKNFSTVLTQDGFKVIHAQR